MFLSPLTLAYITFIVVVAFFFPRLLRFRRSKLLLDLCISSVEVVVGVAVGVVFVVFAVLGTSLACCFGFDESLRCVTLRCWCAVRLRLMSLGRCCSIVVL